MAASDEMYSVLTSNPFALLNEDESKPKPAPKKAAPAPQKQAAPAKKQPVKTGQTGEKPKGLAAKQTKPGQSKQGGNQGAPAQGGRGRGRGFNNKPLDQNQKPRFDKPRQLEQSGEQGNAEGTKDTRAYRPRGDRQNFNDNKRREFRPRNQGEGYQGKPRRFNDRHPGSGRPFNSNTKRQGGGQYQWGKEGDEINDIDIEQAKAGKPSTAAPLVAEDGAAATEGATNGEATKEVDAAAKDSPKEGKGFKGRRRRDEESDSEEETGLKQADMVLFEDFQKQRKTPTIALPPPRKAGEGVSANPDWAKAVPLSKQDDENLIPATLLKKKKASKKTPGATKKTKESVPLSQLVHIKPRPRDDERRGRGRGFGREGQPQGERRFGGRGQNRGPRKFGRGGNGGKSQAPNFDDTSFPTLS
jgi:plasminogen activator inhibitor 1 RNA-binding protein